MNTSVASLAQDIESSAEYQALLLAAAGRPERSMGESVIPAEPPVWSEVRQRATDLLSDPPHLSVIVHLVKADAHLSGFAGLHKSLQLMTEKLTDQWDEVLPHADPDDPEDPFYERVNHLREIAEDPAFIKSLPLLPLVTVRGIGAFSSHDVDIAGGQVSASEEELARCQEGLIRGAFEQAEILDLQTVNASMSGIIDLSVSIESLFNERAGREHALSFVPLRTCIEKCMDRFLVHAQPRLATSTAPSSDTTEADSQITEAHYTAEQGSDDALKHDAALNNRASVCNAFDQIIRYYQQHEPSSPVPILAYRARNMVNKSFFEVLDDLAPSEKGNMPALLAALNTNPLASLMSESYLQFVSGDVIAVQASTHALPTDEESHASVTTGANVQSGESVDSGANYASGESDYSGRNGNFMVSSRSDAGLLLNSIEAYFNRQEPSSPVPLVVAEIRKLIPKRFTELIQEFSHTLDTAGGQSSE